jgi:hypothetical protein
MKPLYRLLVTGFLACGFVSTACVSGDTVKGGSSGGKTGTTSSGGHTGTTSSGGFTGTTSSGGFTGTTSQGGFTGTTSQGGFTGTTGSGGLTGAGTGGTTVATGPCTVAATDALIDDLEKAGNGVMHACVHGYWYTYNDGSAGTQLPPATLFTNVAITDRPGSTFAAYSKASGFTGDTATPANIFAGFGLDFNSSSAAAKYTVNATAFRGVSFWAKGSGTINVNLPTSATDPTLGCVQTATNKCYDVSFKPIILMPTWTLYNLMWSDFAQAGFGTKETLTGSNIGGIKFESKATAPAAFPPYEMWVDDLKFLQ